MGLCHITQGYKIGGGGGGLTSKTTLLFSKVFRRAESKNDISFGPTRHVISQIEKIIFSKNSHFATNIKHKDTILTQLSRIYGRNVKK